MFPAILLVRYSAADFVTTEDLESLERVALAYSSATSAKDAATVMSSNDKSVLMMPPNAEFVVNTATT